MVVIIHPLRVIGFIEDSMQGNEARIRHTDNGVILEFKGRHVEVPLTQLDNMKFRMAVYSHVKLEEEYK